MEPRRLQLVAPCGIDCANCPLHNCDQDPALMDHMTQRGIPREKLPCPGCRSLGGDCPVLRGTCETYACAQERKVEFCYQCADFPCPKPCPSAQRADVLPHNLKVFNLCTIRRVGLEDFVKASAELERRYFKGRMEVGKGPALA